MIAHVEMIAAATDLPVSADLENGFGDRPENAAETIRLAARAGAVGGSIEDSTTRADDPIYPHDLAVERVRARPIKRDVELDRGTGLRSRHQTGPYQRTGPMAQ